MEVGVKTGGSFGRESMLRFLAASLIKFRRIERKEKLKASYRTAQPRRF